mgnify:CR=1 FL=1
MKIEYRVRKVERYIVTCYREKESGDDVAVKGEYHNPEVAYEVAYALCKAEHYRLGCTPDDERGKYPEPLVPTGYTLKTEAVA